MGLPIDDEELIDLEDLELLNRIRDGYFICNKCKSLMKLNDDDQLICSCGYVVNHNDYDYEEYFEEDDTEPPFGCQACGGPYPQCKTSCKLFDE